MAGRTALISPSITQGGPILRELVLNYRHPGPRRVWKVGSGWHLLTPLPVAPVAPEAPLVPVANSFLLPFTIQAMILKHQPKSFQNTPKRAPEGPKEPQRVPREPQEVQMEPKGYQKETKRSPKGSIWVVWGGY